jgi:hypothetical protein
MKWKGEARHVLPSVLLGLLSGKKVKVALTEQRASDRVSLREDLVELSSLPMRDKRRESPRNRKSKTKQKNKDNSTMLGVWLLKPHGVRVSSFRPFWVSIACILASRQRLKSTHSVRRRQIRAEVCWLRRKRSFMRARWIGACPWYVPLIQSQACQATIQGTQVLLVSIVGF